MLNENKSDIVKLLWTGGWDSTFRLLQLLLEEKKCTQPYYFVDPKRPSTGVEIQSMGKLKTYLYNHHPHTKKLLLPAIYINIETIEPDTEIRKAYHSLKNFVPLGNQYLWIPEYCKQNQVYELEMSIENGANEDLIWRNLNYLKNQFSENPGHLSKEEKEIFVASKTLFRYFKFPIIHLSKRETFAIAKKKGWMTIMDKTWFCYNPLFVPLRGLVPCGNCVTCRFQQKSGFGWRIPFYVKLFQYIRYLKNKIVGAVR